MSRVILVTFLEHGEGWIEKKQEVFPSHEAAIYDINQQRNREKKYCKRKWRIDYIRWEDSSDMYE